MQLATHTPRVRSVRAPWETCNLILSPERMRLREQSVISQRITDFIRSRNRVSLPGSELQREVERIAHDPMLCMPIFGPDCVFGPDVISGTDFNPSFLSGLSIWTRSDDPGVVESGGLITSIPNRGSIGGLIENSGTPRPTDSILKGRRSPLFDGSEDYLIDDWAAAPNIFLHDGTGCTFLIVVRRSDEVTLDKICGTYSNSASHRGFRLRADNGTDRLVFTVANGSGTLLVNDSTVGAVPGAATRVIWFKHKTGESPEWSYGHDATELDNGSYVGTPSSSNATRSLEIGRSATDPFIGHIPEVVAYADYKSDAEIQQVVDYLTAKWV